MDTVACALKKGALLSYDLLQLGGGGGDVTWQVGDDPLK